MVVVVVVEEEEEEEVVVVVVEVRSHGDRGAPLEALQRPPWASRHETKRSDRPER